MPDIIISEKQLQLITKHKLVESEVIEEASWYNTAMDVIGIVDPTPITDSINAASYFAQGDTLYGILSLVAAVPFFVGDFVAKPIMNMMKVGSKSTKELEEAIKLAAKGGPSADKALVKISELAKDPGPVGKFLQSAGGSSGWAKKTKDFIKELPDGKVFGGLKNTIMDYFTILERAGTKSKGFSGLAKSLEADLKAGKAGVKDIEALRDILKSDKIFDVAALSKPGALSQTFFGGIPRIFRSPEGRRVKILMQQTKWWLGFLDYIGLGNWVGPEEVAKKLGSEEEMIKALEKYQLTPEARKYFEESFTKENKLPGENVVGDVKNGIQKSFSSDNTNDDPFAGLLRKVFTGAINPIPGM